jgi:putative transposase
LPKVIKVDNGPEFISKELDLWAYSNKVELDYSRPGKPTDNAFIESFNGKVRQECLNQHWFLSLSDAKVKLELWREDYNSSRPHSSLNYTHLWLFFPKNNHFSPIFEFPTLDFTISTF